MQISYYAKKSYECVSLIESLLKTDMILININKQHIKTIFTTLISSNNQCYMSQLQFILVVIKLLYIKLF